MKTFAIAIAAAVCAWAAALAEPVCVDGVCYPSAEAAREAGVSAGDIAAHAPPPGESAADGSRSGGRRLAMGYMSAPEMLEFLRGDGTSGAGMLEGRALWAILALVLLGGLAANLTPCVLPLVPVNLILMGRGWRRGAAYAAGIATAYGALGLAAAFGGMAFGAVQSSVYFNAFAALVFAVLALAMLDIVRLPGLSSFRRTGAGNGGATPPGRGGAAKAYLLGAGAATLAGACVEPILLATLLLTAKWVAAGRIWAVCLPFVLGAGMGLPYPFAAAGLAVLPRPGAWMVWVKRAFAAVFLAMCAWYGWQAAGIATGRGGGSSTKGESGAAATGTGAKPVFVKVGAPWCRNCAAMDRTVFNDPEIAKELEAFEVRKIEIDSFEELARHPELDGLDIKGLPAYVILPAADAAAGHGGQDAAPPAR